MTWLPWLLLFALGAAAAWAMGQHGAHLRWARRALRGDVSAQRPQGWLVRALQLEELFMAIERRAWSSASVSA